MVSLTIIENPDLPDVGTTSEDGGMANLGVAMGLVMLAGGATSIGAAVVYIPSLVNLANNNTLAISLGLSAGVMIFVSFIEIFGKSQESFEEAGFKKEQAYALAMVTFFAGAAMMLISHYVLEFLMGSHGRDLSHENDADTHKKSSNYSDTDLNLSNSSDDSDVEAASPKKKVSFDKKKKAKLKKRRTLSFGEATPSRKEKVSSKKKTAPEYRPLDTQASSRSIDHLDPESDWGNMMLPCFDHEEDIREKVKSYHEMAKEMQEYEEKKTDRQLCLEAGVPKEEVDGHENFQGIKEQVEKRQDNDRAIMKLMSYKTAFAIALHNFPEGLATFVAALADPKMGLVLAIGIAIHNIPEGLAVALPMYYATGNRNKAFLCGALSGCTEILAALLGWAVLANAFSATLYAVVFGLVSGMMVLISVRELLPTAHRHDPHDKYVTLAFTGGMVFMALSLALIALC